MPHYPVKELCLNSNFFSAYLCVPLRLCGKCARTTCLPQSRRGTQRYAEKVRHHRDLYPKHFSRAKAQRLQRKPWIRVALCVFAALRESSSRKEVLLGQH